jgi:hypothetical protein
MKLLPWSVSISLGMTDSKNRFILVCVDYATKYPEAIALRDQEASTVSNAQDLQYSDISLNIPGQKKCCIILSLVFLFPR